MTFVLGLTGSIGMGKSATAGLFRELGIPVHDADGSVHALYRGRAAPLVEAAFPGTVAGGVVDRAALARRVLGSGDEMRRLEAIVHPLVRAEEASFLRDAVLHRRPLVVLDVPLLIETGGAARCDAVLVVTADPGVQRLRVLARPGMSEEKFAAILDKQVPDSEKRRRAHFIVDTGSGFPRARAAVSGIVRALAGRPGRLLAGRAPQTGDET
ncbi:MAG: dephospho-CoA kinase [Enterovirga sp.]|nr:dephospho-CoA kinase [Enterovirga sp.]